jgi:hypothetical protein
LSHSSLISLSTAETSLVVRRYERASLIVTSNKSFLDWGEVFNDPVLATAILDRLLHYSTTLNIKGESYQLKEKRRAGLLGRSTSAEPEVTGELKQIAADFFTVEKGTF